MSTNATPEPVRKNRTLTIRGHLKRADRYPVGTQGAVAPRWLGVRGKKVELQFRTPKGSYTKVKTVTSKSKGAPTTTVKATRDGCYRFSYAGNSTKTASKAWSVPVFVDA